MSKALNLANLGRNSAKLLFEKNVSQKYGSFLPLNVTPVSQRKAYSAYYGEPAEYKESQGNVLLVNEENTKWKSIPGNCNFLNLIRTSYEM